MSDPVPNKSQWQTLGTILEEACEALPFSSNQKSLEKVFQWGSFPGREIFERSLSWSRQFDRSESFSASTLTALSGVKFDSTGLIFTPLPLEPEVLKPFTAGLSRREYAALSGWEEYAGVNAMQDGLRCCLPENSEPSAEMPDTAAARQAFIENLAVNIVDPSAMNHFMGIMQGLLKDEPDPSKWTQLYEEHFAWSAEDLAALDEYAFTYEDGLTQSIAGEASALLASNPKASGYVAGLVLKAQSLYGAEDPDFVEEYEEYVQFTLHTLVSENKLNGIVSLEDHLKSPEDYRKRGFLNLPERPENAMSGSEFMQNGLGIDLKEFKTNPRQLGSLSRIDRENAILEQIEMGNVPDFLRRPKAVVIKDPSGVEVKTYVMPDYVAIGSNSDFVRVPLSPIIAQALARQYGLSLPTKTIVEETYEQAGKRVVGPSYTHPDEFEQNSAYLDSPGFYLRSSEDIQIQLKGVEPGTLVAGGKKELVVSPFVSARFAGSPPDESIAFYGLYDESGIPIQRTPGHGGEAGYHHTEYALGVRFISPMIVVRESSGEKRVIKMDEALKNPEVAKIISRVERTETMPNLRSSAFDGSFDASTVYRQNPPKGLKKPHGPGSA